MTAKQQIKNAAILLFGKKPQRFFPTSEIKCAQFYGNEVTKPIPSYQVYQGDLFSLVTQALDFVASRIDARVGTREHGVQAPIDFELPLDAISEAIVNAVAHRDYTSNASIQVMLFKNRLEIWNPGHLPPGITIEQLSQVHESFPTNPLIANPLYLAGLVERLGTGTSDIIKKCAAMGLKPPTFSQSNNFRTTIWRNEKLNDATSDANPITSDANPTTSNAYPTTSDAYPTTSDANPTTSIPKRMDKTQLEDLILHICLDEYVTINHISIFVGRTPNHLVREILPDMIAAKKLERLYPEIPNHPEQRYKTILGPEVIPIISDANDSPNLTTSGQKVATSEQKVATSEQKVATSKANANSFYGKKLSQNELEKIILEICKNEYVQKETLAQILGKSEDYIRNKILPELLKTGKLEKCFPFTDNHPGQGYKTTEEYADKL